MGAKINAHHFDTPGTRRQQPCQHLDGGGFSRAVRTQKAKKLPGGHLQIHVVYGDKVSKTPGELFCANCDVRHDFSVCARRKTLARLRENTSKRLIAALEDFAQSGKIGGRSKTDGTRLWWLRWTWEPRWEVVFPWTP